MEETTTVSWGSRLKDALMGILVGFALIIGGSVLIFWNESHGLHTAQSLEEAQKLVVSVPNSPVDKQNNLKVVYFSGLATTKDELNDSIFGITANAIRLERKVEMYQWEEKKETKKESQMGGSEKQITTYSYGKTWSSSLINSSNFKTQEGHENPSSMPIESSTKYAQKVTLGDFTLPSQLISHIDVTTPIDLNKINKDALQEQFKKPVSINNQELYMGQDSQSPKTGDLRITLDAVYPQDVSVLGQQTDSTLQPYLAKAGETVLLLDTGIHSPQEMIAKALSENSMMTWILRLLALILLIAGFGLIMKPLVILADVIPFLGSVVGFGTGFIACVLGGGLWLVLTAIAWFTTRPLLSIGLLAIAAVGGYLLIQMRKKKEIKPV